MRLASSLFGVLLLVVIVATVAILTITTPRSTDVEDTAANLGGAAGQWAVTNTKESAVATYPANVLIILDAKDFRALRTEVETLKRDVETKYGLRVGIRPISGLKAQTPDAIRDILRTECNPTTTGCAHLEGAIFIGDAPYALYEQVYDHNRVAPFMFFYQDLDAGFLKNGDGRYYAYDTYGAHEGPEIYVSWIRGLSEGALTEQFKLGTKTEQIRRYLEKHHEYLTVQLPETDDASVDFALVTHCPDSIRGYATQLLGIQNLYWSRDAQLAPTSDCDAWTDQTTKGILHLMQQQPEAMLFHSHGSERTLIPLMPADILRLNGQPTFLLSWGCRVGNFHGFESDSFALSFINSPRGGLAMLAKLEDTDIGPGGTEFVNSQVILLEEHWTKGKYLGRALLDMEQDFAHRTIPGDPELKNIYRISGPLQRIIIGSPFVAADLRAQRTCTDICTGNGRCTEDGLAQFCVEGCWGWESACPTGYVCCQDGYCCG